MTRTQRSVHARTFAVLTPLFAVLIVLALVRSHRTAQRLNTPPHETHAQGVVP